jgi:hypothetical protein
MAGDIFDFFQNVADVTGDVVGFAGKQVGGLVSTAVEGTGDFIDEITGKAGRERVKAQQAKVRASKEELADIQQAREKAKVLENRRQLRRQNRIRQAVIRQGAISAGVQGSSSVIGAQASVATQFLAGKAAQAGENLFADVIGDVAQDLATEQDFLISTQTDVAKQSQFKRDIFNTFLQVSSGG